MPRILCVAMVAVVAVGCAESGATLSDADRVAVADSVAAAMHSYEAAVKSLDVQRVLAHYGDSARFRFTDNGTAYSYAEMRRMVQQLFGSLRSLGGGFGAINVTVLSRDVALADGPYTDIFTDTSGTVMRIRGTVTWVWTRGPDGWRIVHGQAFGAPDTTATR